MKRKLFAFLVLIVAIGGAAWFFVQKKTEIEGLGGVQKNTARISAGINGLGIEDLVMGDGLQITAGDLVAVNYIGTLADGTKFDSSYDRGKAFLFTVGARQVIRGWDEGVIGMRVHGKRRLVVAPEMAYGAAGAGNLIPPNATLVFEIELLDANSVKE